MAANDEWSDPLGWIIAGTAGAIATVVLWSALSVVAVLVGVVIVGAVMGVKVATSSRRPQLSQRRAGQLPRPPRNSEQSRYLGRCEAAVARLTDLTERNSDDWLHARVGQVDDQARDVLVSVRELAGRATVLQSSISAANPVQLQQDVASLQAQIAATQDPALRAERERTLVAVQNQVSAIGRMQNLLATLYSRMHSTAVDLEGLASRVGELVAMGSDTVREEYASQVVSELTSDLDTMREAIVATESETRRWD